MKIGIIYASKTGTTEKAAKELYSKIGKNVELVNIKEKNNSKVDLKKYDFIILGSPIRMGVIDKDIRSILTDRNDELKNKKTAMFICCGMEEMKKNHFINNVSKPILDNFVVYDSFGGMMNMDKQKGLDKFIVKMVSKNNSNMNENINEENIEKFASKIK